MPFGFRQASATKISMITQKPILPVTQDPNARTSTGTSTGGSPHHYVRHPYHDYDSLHALKLARSLKFEPFPKEGDPTPDAKEALAIIETHRKKVGFNWITGRVASEVLRASLGEDNPFTSAG